MLFAVLNQILLIPAFVGLGLGMHRYLFKSQRAELAQLIPPSAGHFGLMGIVGAVFLACLLNLFLPLGEPYALAAFLLLGYGALFFSWRSAPGVFSPRGLGLLFALVLLTSFIAICFGWFYDVGLYHIPTILWARLYALPFGLANLEPFQSYNSSWFVLEGALFFKPGDYSIAFSLNTTLVTLFFHAIFTALKEAVASWRGRHYSLALLLVCFLLGNYLLWNGSLSPNVAAYLFALYSWFFILRFFETKLPLGALLGFGFALFALTAKLFALPSVLIAGAVVLYCGWAHRKDWRSFLHRYRSLNLFFSLYLCLWFVRGLAISGCLLYPQMLTCFTSIPWATSLEKVVSLSKEIQRTNGGALYGYFTLKQPLAVVWKEASLNLTTPFAWKTYFIGFSGLVVLLLSKLKRWAGPSSYDRNLFLFGALAQAVGILFWMLTTSNAPRFGIHYLLMLSALALGLGLSTVERVPKSWPLFPLVLLLWAFIMGARTSLKTADVPLLWTNWPEIKHFEVQERLTASGQVVRSSLTCNDAPPPCTHDFEESISYTPRFGGSFIFYRK